MSFREFGSLFILFFILNYCHARPAVEPQGPSNIVVGDATEESTTIPPTGPSSFNITASGNETHPEVIIVVRSNRPLTDREKGLVTKQVKKWWESVVKRLKEAAKKVANFFKGLFSRRSGSSEPKVTESPPPSFLINDPNAHDKAFEDMLSKRRVSHGGSRWNLYHGSHNATFVGNGTVVPKVDGISPNPMAVTSTPVTVTPNDTQTPESTTSNTVTPTVSTALSRRATPNPESYHQKGREMVTEETNEVYPVITVST